METIASAGSSSTARPPTTAQRRLIAGWLLGIATMILVMIILGGVTRLTHSGLSMVEWRPLTGWLPPLTEAAWQRLFEAYQQFPEYKKLNYGMTLGEFQGIFWLEFLHRLWGRLIGLAFLLPALYFAYRRWLDRPLITKLAIMFVLGGLQGVLGWYMVKSGLVNDPDVSQYRLTAHFGAALVILGYILWTALSVLHPISSAPIQAPRRLAWLVLGWALITALSGALVAGLDAGFTYNTFPLMDGQWIPHGLYDGQPFWLSAFEDITTVQFNHRSLAESLAVMVALLWLSCRRAGLSGRPQRIANLLGLLVVLQVTLGITTLLLVVPVALAATHQAGAVVVLAVTLWLCHELRRPG